MQHLPQNLSNEDMFYNLLGLCFFLLIILFICRKALLIDIKKFLDNDSQKTRLSARPKVFRSRINTNQQMPVFNLALNPLETPDFLNPKRIAKVKKLAR